MRRIGLLDMSGIHNHQQIGDSDGFEVGGKCGRKLHGRSRKKGVWDGVPPHSK